MNAEFIKTSTGRNADIVKPKIRKVGSGRKKGSYSFAKISVGQLYNMFPNNMPVLVSRKWAQMIGIKVKGIKATPALKKV